MLVENIDSLLISKNILATPSNQGNFLDGFLASCKLYRNGKGMVILLGTQGY